MRLLPPRSAPRVPDEFLPFESFEAFNRKPYRALAHRMAVRAVYWTGATASGAILGVMPFVGINYDIGPLQTRVEPTLTGDSLAHSAGTAHIPLSKGRVGLEVTPLGVPVQSFDNSSGDIDLLSPSTLTAFAEVYQDTDKTFADAERKIRLNWLEKATDAECALLLAGAGTKRLVRSVAVAFGNKKSLLGPDLTADTRLAPYFNPTIKAGVTIVACQAIAGIGLTMAPIHPRAPEECKIPGLENTVFQGTWSCTEPLYSALGRGIPIVQGEIAAQKEELANFEATAIASIEAQKDRIAQPGEDEFSTWEVSDFHDSIAMSTIYTYLGQYLHPKVFTDNGDPVDGGLPAEDTFVKNEAGITTGKKVGVRGNHNSDTTDTQMEHYGFRMLNGETISTGGLSFLGDKDPNRTPLLQDTYQTGDIDNLQMGEELREKAKRDRPDVFMVHEAEAAAALVKYIEEGHERVASLVLWGHNHTQQGPYVVWNTDGTWTVICQLSTAAGFPPGSNEVLNLPFSTPEKLSRSIQFFWNKKSRLVTGYQIITTRPDGNVVFSPRVNVGSPDGLPYPPEHIQSNRDQTLNEVTEALG